MQLLHGDRRKSEQHFSFPLIDSEGYTVTSERRRGKKRRKGRRRSDIAGKILNIIN